MKKVPLVVYRDGERKVIGEAVVSAGGEVHGKITTTEVSLDGVLGAGMAFGASLGPFGTGEEDG